MWVVAKEEKKVSPTPQSILYWNEYVKKKNYISNVIAASYTLQIFNFLHIKVKNIYIRGNKSNQLWSQENLHAHGKAITNQ